MTRHFIWTFLIIFCLGAALIVACRSGSKSSGGGSAPLGACCMSGGCAATPYENCGGNWLGANTICVPNPCAADDDASPDDDVSPDDDAADTWTDSSSGLMWQNGSAIGAQVYLQAEAATYCANLSWGGYTGWRLPSISELRSLVRGCDATAAGGLCGVTDSCSACNSCWTSSCAGCATLGGPGANGAYWPTEIAGLITWCWASTTVPDISGSAWRVHFDAAKVDDSSVESPYYGGARCVRTAAARP